MPRISILMAAYNAQKYVRQAIDSVLSQTMMDWELLVVDDASTDDTQAILREYIAQDERIKLFCQNENKGQAVARNIALQQAKGDYICMLDADDWFAPDTLEYAVAEFSHPEVDCVVLQLINHYLDGSEEIFNMPYSSGMRISGEMALRFSLDMTIHGLMLVRRELHLKYPYDDSLRLNSDDNTACFHYLHSRQVAFSNGRYYYRRHPQSKTGSVSRDMFCLIVSGMILHEDLKREGVSQEILDLHDDFRWQCYVGYMRLMHMNRRLLGEANYAAVHNDFLRVYASFHRSVPFVLFEIRQYVGYLWQRMKKACNSFGRKE